MDLDEAEAVAEVAIILILRFRIDTITCCLYAEMNVIIWKNVGGFP